MIYERFDKNRAIKRAGLFIVIDNEDLSNLIVFVNEKSIKSVIILI